MKKKFKNKSLFIEGVNTINLNKPYKGKSIGQMIRELEDDVKRQGMINMEVAKWMFIFDVTSEAGKKDMMESSLKSLGFTKGEIKKMLKSNLT